MTLEEISVPTSMQRRGMAIDWSAAMWTSSRYTHHVPIFILVVFLLSSVPCEYMQSDVV